MAEYSGTSGDLLLAREESLRQNEGYTLAQMVLFGESGSNVDNFQSFLDQLTCSKMVR